MAVRRLWLENLPTVVVCFSKTLLRTLEVTKMSQFTHLSMLLNTSDIPNTVISPVRQSQFIPQPCSFCGPGVRKLALQSGRQHLITRMWTNMLAMTNSACLYGHVCLTSWGGLVSSLTTSRIREGIYLHPFQVCTGSKTFSEFTTALIPQASLRSTFWRLIKFYSLWHPEIDHFHTWNFCLQNHVSFKNKKI